MRSIRSVGLVAAVSATLVVTALPASAGCETSIPGCGLDHDDTTATSLHVRQISTVVPLRTDNEGLSFQIYASLIPAQYDIPNTPEVAVSIADVVEPAGGVEQLERDRWIESTISIKVANDGVDGWYPISNGTNTDGAWASGRELGWPTYEADLATLEATDTGWAGVVSLNDTPTLTLDWTPDDSDVTDAVADWTLQRDPFLSLTPTFTGPDRLRVQNSAKPPAPLFDAVGGAPDGTGVDGVTNLAPLQSGLVHLTIDPNLNELDAISPDPTPDLPFSEGRTLGEVIELDQTLAGSFWETDQTRFTQTDQLDDGQDGPLPQAPAVSARGAIVAPPNATLTGFVPPVVALPQGSSLDFTNSDTGTHDVTSVDFDPVTYKAKFHAQFAAPGQTHEVEGVESLPPGQYDFVCSIHRGQMTGTLFIF